MINGTFPIVLAVSMENMYESINLNIPASMYYNYKHFFSINLFAISDANYKFILVDIGVYGRESDGGVLKNSVFFSKLQKKELSIPDDIEVPNTNIIAPYIFIGDEAFPLLTNIQRPYPGKQLINDEKKRYSTIGFHEPGALLKMHLGFYPQNGEY